MEKYMEALNRGKRVRSLQSETLALFVLHIQNIDDEATLQAIKKSLQTGGKV
ncbi:hypothetical protein [Bacillus sp. es.036]|uniref:hypothetical protein n=1 Tax=Bacillus sp. es.036 TaxID=1761764 RepID=UPI000C01628E|nr:hypothetical protein [Bacillus sp. es.036]PFG03034.1 hypothetical protein ATG70_4263 [Bacillus sp. es.036]